MGNKLTRHTQAELIENILFRMRNIFYRDGMWLCPTTEHWYTQIKALPEDQRTPERLINLMDGKMDWLSYLCCVCSKPCTDIVRFHDETLNPDEPVEICDGCIEKAHNLTCRTNDSDT